MSKRCMITMAFMLSSFISLAQREYQSNSIIYHAFKKPDKKGIRYELPRAIQANLDSFYTKINNKKNKRSSFFMELCFSNDTCEIYFNSIGKRRFLSKRGYLQSVIYASNRYVIIANRRIPFYSCVDAKYGNLNTSVTGGLYYIKFLIGQGDTCRVLESEFTP